MFEYLRDVRDRRREWLDARERLDAVTAFKPRPVDETDEYLAANQAVIDAEKRVPVWARWYL